MILEVLLNSGIYLRLLQAYAKVYDNRQNCCWHFALSKWGWDVFEYNKNFCWCCSRIMNRVKKELKWLIKPTLDTKPAEEIAVQMA